VACLASRDAKYRHGQLSSGQARWPARGGSDSAAADASFALGGLTEGQCATVTAWLDGYYVGWQVVTPTVSAITITPSPYPKGDNEDYVWRSALDPEEDPRFTCSHCMVAFPEWEAGAHGRSARNPRFFSMYNGTDVSATVRVGAGYVQDFPGTAGNCATCHAPAAASGRQRAFAVDMNELQPGVEQEGVGCDFCHHIGGVYLNPATGLPYPNAPGVLSYRLYRTYDPDVLFLGPLDDVTRRVSFLPLEKKSQFCAPCHQFSFWGTPIYQSFSEWLESPYPAQGIECQTCHMPAETVPYFVYPDIPGGLTRDPSTLASHLDLGVKDPEFMRKTVAMTVTAQISGTSVSVDVAITNVFAGHDVPTDYPGRNMILVVKARDGEGHELAQIRGPEVPDWGGVGSQPGDYAGQPGKGYAKILRDRLRVPAVAQRWALGPDPDLGGRRADGRGRGPGGGDAALPPPVHRPGTGEGMERPRHCHGAAGGAGGQRRVTAARCVARSAPERLARYLGNTRSGSTTSRRVPNRCKLSVQSSTRLRTPAVSTCRSDDLEDL
jgi:hypothetical protein